MKISFIILILMFPILSFSQSEFGKNEENNYRQFLSTLASDKFQGRKPFTEGEELTVNYLRKEFESIGLQPGNGKSYFQNVPMVEISGRFKNNKVTIKGSNGDLNLQPLTEIVGGTRRVVKEQTIENVPMVFAGFGIDAPEYHWNDFEGMDVKGKIIVVMVNDPGFYNSELFRGKDMTYYGR